MFDWNLVQNDMFYEYEGSSFSQKKSINHLPYLGKKHMWERLSSHIHITIFYTEDGYLLLHGCWVFIKYFSLDVTDRKFIL
jgi:hypothetical protein